MKTFVNTGWNPSTFTSCDDPELIVTEISNGNRWVLEFNVGQHTIDVINLEYPTLYTINDEVAKLLVHNENGEVIGQVYKIVANAINLDNRLHTI